MLKTKTVGAKSTPAGIEVTFAAAQEGGTAPAPQTYDLVLQAVGRSPNGNKIAADKAGVAVTDRGFIPVDIQMRTNVPHIFAIGDLVGQPMLAHKAVHEAHVAAEVIAGELQGNQELASAAYTDPEIAWVGLTEDQAKAQGIEVRKGLFPWTASGRAIANGRHACGRHGRRDCAGDRDGRRRHRHRQDHPPAPHAGREHWHGGGGGARQLHVFAACAQVANRLKPQHQARTLTGSGFLLSESPEYAHLKMRPDREL